MLWSHKLQCIYMDVKPVGIRELKKNLSKYLQNVKKGNGVIVSDRGKAIAQIVPYEPQSEQSRLQSLLLKLSVKGKIILPSVYKKPSLPTSREKLKGSPFSDAVKEDRR